MNPKEKTRISGKVVLREMNKVIGVVIGKEKNGEDDIIGVDNNMNAYKNDYLRGFIADGIRMRFSFSEDYKYYSDFDLDKLKKYFHAYLEELNHNTMNLDEHNNKYNRMFFDQLIENLKILQNRNRGANVNVDSIIGLIETEDVITGEENKNDAKFWLVMSEFDFFCKSDLDKMQKKYEAEELAHIIARALSPKDFKAICNYIDDVIKKNNSGGRKKNSKYVKKTKKNNSNKKRKTTKNLKINKRNMKK